MPKREPLADIAHERRRHAAELSEMREEVNRLHRSLEAAEHFNATGCRIVKIIITRRDENGTIADITEMDDADD